VVLSATVVSGSQKIDKQSTVMWLKIENDNQCEEAALALLRHLRVGLQPL